MRKNKTLALLSGVVAATLISLTPAANGAVSIELTNLGSSAVHVGDTIIARVRLATDNPNGLSNASARINQSTVSVGGTAITSGAGLGAVPISSIPGNNGTSNPSPITVTFAPSLTSAGDVTLATSASVFDASGVPQTNPQGTRPLAGFSDQTTLIQHGGVKFFTSADISQSANLFQFLDIPFVARNVGTFFFSLTPNAGTIQEYDSLTGTSATSVTPTFLGGGGFAVTITSVPEPTSLGLAGIAGLGLLARRRRMA